MPHPMRRSAAGRVAESAEKGRVKLELGMDITMLKSHKMGEQIAKLREELEDRKTSIDKRLVKLLDQMRADKVEHFSAKAPGGSIYAFDVVASEVKVKVSKPA